ncbi:glycoside hydrolase family 5 protein [Tilletiaria anomala UBC 951]|uniref:glucan 1,3-beta-glucosidase n=1 Tax=Tilletiaria anomala (strain ATCC 24038 / CBS 436.72 / UBC 951) TaxID=1037660 RepID=A0A066VRK5_TILAU|nr:glycoside hydrolase family 5 protein [Tilletiaria anomala UBC 951]KDN44126.1 glycoside hydrolase family 5 protein [Tilletiaria anomala UBC 951]
MLARTLLALATLAGAFGLPPPTIAYSGDGQFIIQKVDFNRNKTIAGLVSPAYLPGAKSTSAAPKPAKSAIPAVDAVQDATPAVTLTPAWDYGGSKKVRGVNIGGWLVAEPWITPSLFDNTGDNRVIDEWTFGQYVSDAKSRLQKHWDTWITENDFSQIAAAGLNHVRIPIGYWAFDTSAGEPYVKGSQYSYLKKAIGWASKHNIKVMVDLHGLPGSQNGFDNSGRKGSITWPNDSNNSARAKKILTTMAKDFATAQYNNTVTIIQAANEPFMVGGPSNMQSYTKQFFRDAYGTIRYDAVQGAQSNIVVGLHDGFEGLSYWSGFMPSPQYQQVLMDQHIYTVFSPQEVSQSKSSRFKQICSHRNDIKNNQGNLWTVIGEWTVAPTDCAKYLNGRGVGARYDGSYPGSSYVGDCSTKTGDGSNFSSSYKAFLAQMFATQISVYETGSGWIMWTWKTEQAADWDYQRGLAGGWIPKKLDNPSNVQC